MTTSTAPRNAARTLEDDIIAGMQLSYQSSNLQELNLGEQTDLINHVALLLQSAPDKNNYQNPITFDPAQLTFVHKYASPPIIEKRLRTTKKDYFKAVVFTDFYINFIVRDAHVLDTIKEREPELERIDPYLDNDIGLVARQCALHYLAEYRMLGGNDTRRTNYNSTQERETSYTPFRRADPVYTATAKITLDQISNQKILDRVKNTKRLVDLCSLAFIDICISQSPRMPLQEILPMLDEGKYLAAAHKAMEEISPVITRRTMTSYIAQMQPTTYD